MPSVEHNIDEVGFSVVEVAVALTLMAIAVVGAMSLLGASTTEFFKSQSRSKVEMVANGLLDELTLRHANGDTITSMTIDDWSSYLTSNDISTVNATLVISDKTGLSDYSISATSLTENYLVVSGGTGTPEVGDIFLIEDNRFHMELGWAYEIDNVNCRHGVANGSEYPRDHLIFDLFA